jgi:PPOX class probable F420-dependent enzyme
VGRVATAHSESAGLPRLHLPLPAADVDASLTSRAPVSAWPSPGNRYYGHPMDLDDARGVIREQHRAVLATTRNDGTPHMSPVPVAVDDDGCALVSTRETAAKVGNLRRDPRSWLCVLPDGFFGRWVQVEGRGEIVYLPEAMDGLEDYYRRVAGEHDYRAAMRRERRVLLRIALDRAGPDRAG